MQNVASKAQKLVDENAKSPPILSHWKCQNEQRKFLSYVCKDMFSNNQNQNIRRKLYQLPTSVQRAWEFHIAFKNGSTEDDAFEHMICLKVPKGEKGQDGLSIPESLIATMCQTSISKPLVFQNCSNQAWLAQTSKGMKVSLRIKSGISS